MHGYIAHYEGQKIEIRADTLWEAKQKAIAAFGLLFRRVKTSLVSVTLVEKAGDIVSVPIPG